MPYETLLASAVVKAAEPIKQNFRKPATRLLKKDGSPVTETDMAVHEALLAWSKKHGFGYIGEEGNGNTEADHILYVDPLDGTSSFSAGIPTVTTIASIMEKCDEGLYKPIASIIYEPLTGWLWVGSEELPTMHTVFGEFGTSTQSVVDTEARQKLITSICPPGPLRHLRKVRDDINANQPEMKHQACGSLALCGGLIASGMTHGLIFSGGSAAEVCAMMLVVKGAGGVVTNLSGDDLVNFRLGEHKGKVDFVLECGAIMTSDSTLADQLAEMVQKHL